MTTLAGCDLAFGLSDQTAPSAQVSVTGTYGHQMIIADPTGTPNESEVVFGQDELDISAVLADTDAPVVPTFADTTFAFERASATEPYRLAVRAEVESTIDTEIQDVVDSITLRSPYYGRVARTAPAAASLLDFTITLPATPIVTRNGIASTNLRTFTALTAPKVLPGTFSLDWHSAHTLYGGLGLLDATQGDELWYTGSALDPTSSYYAITAVAQWAQTVKSGVTQAVPAATATAVTQDRCVTLESPRRALMNRLEAVIGYTTSETSNWQIFATPIAAISPTAGIQLVVTNIAAATDEAQQVTYANPYPEDTVAELIAQITRTPLLTGTSTGTALGYQLAEYAVVAPGDVASCDGNRLSLDAAIGIPANPALGGDAISVDNTAIDLDRSGPVALTFAPGDSAPVDDYAVTLYEATAVDDATSLRAIRSYSVVTPSVAIDPTLLLVGHSYLFLVSARLGYPGAASRDYSTIAYPFATANIYTGIFQVSS